MLNERIGDECQDEFVVFDDKYLHVAFQPIQVLNVNRCKRQGRAQSTYIY